jgi:hypothetical protein
LGRVALFFLRGGDELFREVKEFREVRDYLSLISLKTL